MMDRIAGYRELAQPEVALINRVKRAQQATDALWRDVAGTEGVDPTWADQARITLETGYMMLVRAIARPVSPFDEPSDRVAPEDGSLDHDPTEDDPSAADTTVTRTGLASPTRSRA